MSKNSLEINKIGSKVMLTDNLSGTVTAVAIRANNYITYECSWWNGSSHDSKWFHDTEIVLAENTEKLRIGFA